MDFGVISVEVSRKFPKNGHIFRKNTSIQGRKFRKYFYTGALTLSPKITLVLYNYMFITSCILSLQFYGTYHYKNWYAKCLILIRNANDILCKMFYIFVIISVDSCVLSYQRLSSLPPGLPIFGFLSLSA